MSKPILHAEALMAYAQGQVVEYKYKDPKAPDHWYDLDTGIPISEFSRTDLEFRIKPKTIPINGIEVPEPVREPLEDGQEYWIFEPSWEWLVDSYKWQSRKDDTAALNRGLIHLTQEAAEKHARALLSFTEIKGE